MENCSRSPPPTVSRLMAKYPRIRPSQTKQEFVSDLDSNQAYKDKVAAQFQASICAGKAAACRVVAG